MCITCLDALKGGLQLRETAHDLIHSPSALQWGHLLECLGHSMPLLLQASPSRKYSRAVMYLSFPYVTRHLHFPGKPQESRSRLPLGWEGRGGGGAGSFAPAPCVGLTAPPAGGGGKALGGSHHLRNLCSCHPFLQSFPEIPGRQGAACGLPLWRLRSQPLPAGHEQPVVPRDGSGHWQIGLLPVKPRCIQHA